MFVIFSVVLVIAEFLTLKVTVFSVILPATSFATTASWCEPSFRSSGEITPGSSTSFPSNVTATLSMPFASFATSPSVITSCLFKVALSFMSILIVGFVLSTTKSTFVLSGMLFASSDWSLLFAIFAVVVCWLLSCAFAVVACWLLSCAFTVVVWLLLSCVFAVVVWLLLLWFSWATIVYLPSFSLVVSSNQPTASTSFSGIENETVILLSMPFESPIAWTAESSVLVFIFELSGTIFVGKYTEPFGNFICSWDTL